MKHTNQAISSLPINPRVVLDISGEPASAPLSTAVQSVGDPRYLLASAVSSGAGWVKLPGGLLVQYGSIVGTTGPAGALTITLPTAFSNTSYSVMAFNGDWVVPMICRAQVPTSRTATAFAIITGQSADPSLVLASTLVRIDYIAVGTAP